MPGSQHLFVFKIVNNYFSSVYTQADQSDYASVKRFHLVTKIATDRVGRSEHMFSISIYLYGNMCLL